MTQLCFPPPVMAPVGQILTVRTKYFLWNAVELVAPNTFKGYENLHDFVSNFEYLISKDVFKNFDSHKS